MKSILVISSLLFISMATLFQGSSVSIDTNMPNYVESGQSFDMEVTVTKGKVAGFSKFQMILPDGFTAENIESQGGTFSFVDQKLKIIWVALPAIAEFKIKFKISTKSSVDGTFPVTGKFSFIMDGERKDTKFDKKIVVSDSKPANLDAITAVPKDKGGQSAVNEPSFAFYRKLSQTEVEPSGTIDVTLEVRKAGISGFGKITEVIPAGFTATEIESNGAIFSQLNNEVRFLWMTLPADDKFVISYKLKANDQQGGKMIKGSFSYVEDDKTRIRSTPTTSLKVTSDGAVATTDDTDDQPDDTQQADDAAAKAEEAKKKAQQEKAEQDRIAAKKKSDAAAAKAEREAQAARDAEAAQANAQDNSDEASGEPGDVSYRVQICATRKPVDTQYFVKNHSVNEHIYTDMHEGWHKFTVGKFSVYGDARDHREEVRTDNKIVGPFVTAYNSGSRITVQEALMISKQQWVP